MTARELARQAFWSDHPLCRLFELANGEWRDGVFVPAKAWSLRELINFAESLPRQVVERLERPT